ncbi:MAG: phage holin family protein [Balneolaceae bacterium]
MMIWAWLLNSISVYATAKLLKGVEIENFWSAIFVAALLALVNVLVKPILLFLSLPLTIITFGLFVWVVNAALIMLVDALVEGFKVRNFGWAILFGMVMSIISWLLFSVFG